MLVNIPDTAKRADEVLNKCGSRDPYRIAKELDIEIMPCRFKLQRGAYKVILKNRFIFIKDDLTPVMKKIVLLHEIGHDVLHRGVAIKSGGFEEYDIFGMQDRQMECEANIFAAQLSLPDDEILEYIKRGCDIGQIARAMDTDENLVAIKADTLIAKGYPLRRQGHSNEFLKYDKNI